MAAPVPLLDTFTTANVLLDLGEGSKAQVLEAMVDHAVAAKALPKARKPQVLDALVAREERASTAFGGGMAMPHCKIDGLKKTAGVIARSVEGVEFKSVDGEPVHVFILLISPESRSEEHLATLQWISQAARDPDFQSFIRQARSAEDVIEVLQERAP